jgi:PhoH-like ATPase
MFTGVQVLTVDHSFLTKFYTEKLLPISELISSIVSEGKYEKIVKFKPFPHLFIVLISYDLSNNQKKTSALAKIDPTSGWLKLLQDYTKHSICGIKARNKEQNMLLNGLMDPTVRCQLITGKAGSGKTICTLAAAFEQVIETPNSPYEQLILTRPMDPVGRIGLGALPGNTDEKFTPYLANFFSNFSFLLGKRSIEYIKTLIENQKIICMPLQLIGGASFNNAFIIADEVQSLNADEMYALGTRAGENSKLVMLGDYRQRYGKKIDLSNTGLFQLMESLVVQESPITCSIQLIKQERSAIAGLFTEVFDPKTVIKNMVLKH